MKLSVIVPVYKVEPFIHKCIDSILNQTHQNLEVILVNDGSPDKCGTICDEYANKDSRIKVIHKENGGLSSARNAGLDIATGDYIAFVDSDDWIDAKMYQSLLYIAEEKDADIVECSYRFHRPWKTENQILETENTKEIKIFNNIQALEELYFGPQLFSNTAIMVWNKIYKFELIKDFRFLEGFIHEDVEFTPRIIYAAKKVARYYDTFYNYNIHLGQNSTSGMKINPAKLKSAIIVRKRILHFFENHPIEKITDYTKSIYINALANGYFESTANKKSSPEFAKMQGTFRPELENYKNEIKSNPYVKPKWKYSLLFHAPFVYVCIVKILRIVRIIPYKLKVILTGKK